MPHPNINWQQNTMHPWRPRQQELFQAKCLGMANLVSTIERNFPTNVRALEERISDEQLDAGLREPWLQRMIYGKMVEKRLERQRLQHPLLKDLGYQTSHVFIKGFPDWFFSWSNHTNLSDRNHEFLQYIDLTTVAEAAYHQAKYGERAATVLTYRRPSNDYLRQLFEGLFAMQSTGMPANVLRNQLRDATKGWAESLDNLDAQRHAADFEAWEKELIYEGSAPAPQPEPGRPVGVAADWTRDSHGI